MKLQVYLESLFSSGEMARAFPWPDTSLCWYFALINTIQRVNVGNESACNYWFFNLLQITVLIISQHPQSVV